jgi:hypothetical protein
MTGVEAGSRKNGSAAVLPLIPGSAISPPPVPPGLELTMSGDCQTSPDRTPSEPSLAVDSSAVGTPLGKNPEVDGALPGAGGGPPRGLGSVGSTGRSMSRSGSDSTQTLSAIPHGLPATAAKLDRGTEYDELWWMPAKIAVTIWKTTTAIAR